MSYFEWRNVQPRSYENYVIPEYLKILLAERFSKDAKILDFGCGLGQILQALRVAGFDEIFGADIERQVLDQVGKTYPVFDASEIDWDKGLESAFDLIIMSHVLEHIRKDHIISHVTRMKRLLKPSGKLLVMVPNAQANTGCYWAYEDFTHEYLFTSGSLCYVLRAAGFPEVEFLDPDCTAGLGRVRRFKRILFLWAYRSQMNFWNRVTASAFHAPSPQIFSYELKALASQR